MAACARHDDEEHELPCVEAVLAGTLALMTGYGQALQADLHPAHRLAMGRRIVGNLELLGSMGALSENFRRVVRGMAQRWQAIGDCTESAAPAALPRPTLAAPTRLQ